MEIFERFKQNVDFSSKKNIEKNVYFVLDFDSVGAFISIRNKKLVEIDVDYTNHSGVDREIIQLINLIKYKNNFIIDWMEHSEKVYLKDNPG